MKNTLFKTLFLAALLVGLLLPSSVLHAQELNNATLSTDPMPSLSTFNDFEEMYWKDEVETVLRKASDLESQGRDNIIVYNRGCNAKRM